MLRVTATKELITRYQRLLLSEWDQELPDQVLALIWFSLHLGDMPEDDPLPQLLNPATKAAFPIESFRSMLELLDDAGRFTRLPGLPELEVEYTPARRPAKHAWQANRLTASLALQACVDATGDVTFLRDLQGLAFQAAANVVLPTLGTKYPAERAALLHAMLLFTLEFPAVDSAHYCYLMSILHGCLGNENERLHFLYTAFRCTPPEDHTFLTKAEEYWSELLDAKRFDEAERFLSSLHWWALPTQQAEVGAMMTAAFKHMLAVKAASA